MNNENKKLGADKIVFLGLFVLSLVLANFIVNVRSSIKLSEAIKLPNTGLSIALPSGEGWQSSEQWQYSSSAYSLQSYYLSDSSLPEVVISCQYTFDFQDTTPEEWFKRIASRNNGIILKEEQIQRDSLTLHCAYIQQPEVFISIYARAQLPEDKLLSIEVHQYSTDIGFAEDIFREIVNNLTYTKDDIVEESVL